MAQHTMKQHLLLCAYYCSIACHTQQASSQHHTSASWSLTWRSVSVKSRDIHDMKPARFGGTCTFACAHKYGHAESKRDAWRAPNRASGALTRPMCGPCALKVRHAKLQRQRLLFYLLLACCASDCTEVDWRCDEACTQEQAERFAARHPITLAPSHAPCAIHAPSSRSKRS